VKLLDTQQQTELRELLEKILDHNSLDLETFNQTNYWVLELKPKRVRKKTLELGQELS
jgi:hypothetical protein